MRFKILLLSMLLIVAGLFGSDPAVYTKSNPPSSTTADSIIFHHLNKDSTGRLLLQSDFQTGFYSLFNITDTIKFLTDSLGFFDSTGTCLLMFAGDSVRIPYLDIDSLITFPKTPDSDPVDSLDVANKKYVDNAVADLATASAITADTLVNQYNGKSAGTLVYHNYKPALHPREDWSTATNTDTTNAGMLLGISVVQSSTDGPPVAVRDNDGKVLVRGIYTTSGLDTDNPIYYIGTSGNITNTRPSASDEVVRIIGYAISPTQLLFRPSEDWGVIK